MSTEAQIKSRSYDVRQDIADTLGKPRSTDFSIPTGTVRVTLTPHPVRDLPAEAWLVSTSNAGFRGIEGWFVTDEGDRIVVSLGQVASWETATVSSWEVEG